MLSLFFPRESERALGGKRIGGISRLNREREKRERRERREREKREEREEREREMARASMEPSFLQVSPPPPNPCWMPREGTN